MKKIAVPRLLSMNRFVMANEVKQSMTSECMDRSASLAMTGQVHGPYTVLARYGGFAMTASYSAL